jgi:hypothetical protein
MSEIIEIVILKGWYCFQKGWIYPGHFDDNNSCFIHYDPWTMIQFGCAIREQIY